jgi:carboxyl-terminal processing protease
MMIRKINSLCTIALAFSTTLAVAQPFAQPNKIEYALQAIKYAYVDTIDEKKVTDDAIRAMIKDLDPHSVYIPVEEMREMNEPLVGKFEGIGIQFNILEDTIMVTQTIPGGPSEKLGIRQGDRIVKIDGVVKAGVKITNPDVLKLLRGDKGTKVTVSILRRGAPDLIDFTITRDQIPLFSVDASYMVTPKIGYIKISRFADNTVEEFKAALVKLKSSGMESLIVDLQGNGGGYLNRAVELSDEFLSDGKKIVFTRGRATQSEDYNSTSAGGFEKGRLAILIDESSASASEIVSGAVQDWDRGLIIGRRSFGKGLVQKPIQLPDGSAIRLTVAHYYTPSGRCIQKPYELGDEETYDLDFSNRIKNGELTNPDSIHFSDSTKYFTNNKRLVHGGGGIMPDIFVPLDTTDLSNFFSDLRRQNAFNDYILAYVDNNRSQLKKDYPTLEDFKTKFNVSEKFMNDFLANAEKLKVKKDSVGLKLSYDLIKLNIKAIIAQNLWNIEGAIEVYNDRNAALRRALDAMNDNTYEKMKIAVN